MGSDGVKEDLRKEKTIRTVEKKNKYWVKNSLNHKTFGIKMDERKKINKLYKKRREWKKRQGYAPNDRNLDKKTRFDVNGILHKQKHKQHARY